jgi:hypothetical protein
MLLSAELGNSGAVLERACRVIRRVLEESGRPLSKRPFNCILGR